MYNNTRYLLIVFFFSLIIYIPVFASKEYTGTVISLDIVEHSAHYDASYSGAIGYVAELGSLGEPYITNIKGDKIIEGTPLFEYEMPYWRNLVKGYKFLTKSSKAELEDARIQLQRYKRLVKPGAVSDEELENYIGKYITALNNYETNKAMISKKYEDVREAAYRPPFEGIVTKIFQTNGIATGQNIIEYTQLNPIGISVKMNRNEARKLSNKTVKIYAIGEKTPRGIFYERTLLTDKGVTFVTENYPVSTLNDPGFKVKVHKDYALVTNFYIKNQYDNCPALGVNKEAIQKDKNGFYVWKVKDGKDMIPGKGIKNIFTASKVYVTPANLFKNGGGNIVVQALKNKGSLMLYDVVLVNAPKDLQKKDKLFFPLNRYILMPGEKIKVVVGK
ncbi:MAG TPA: hypothetical protein QF753_17330 [Victivallales bacterium]|nr:hypothetical protein [Victivallales bacterium]